MDFPEDRIYFLQLEVADSGFIEKKAGISTPEINEV
jgi:hypothetical protein